MLPAIEIRVLSIRAVLHLLNRFKEFKFSQYWFYLTVFGENLGEKGVPFSASLRSKSETGLHVPFLPNTSTLNPSVTFYTLGMPHM